MDTHEIETDLQKKSGQVAKAKTRLDSRVRKNQRRREAKKRILDLIDKSEKKIAEYRKLISYHEDMIRDWREKLVTLPEEDDEVELRSKYDTLKGQFDQMEMLAFNMQGTAEKLESETDEYLRDAYKAVMKKYVKEFKSEKGHGF